MTGRGGRRAAPVAALGLLLALSGCGGPVAHRVCQDQASQKRIDDGECARSSGHPASWVYFSSSQRAPAIGEPVTGGSSSAPKGARVENAPRGGGVVPAKGGSGKGTSGGKGRAGGRAGGGGGGRGGK